MRAKRSRRFSGQRSAAVALGMALLAPIWAQAGSKVQSAYEQLCGRDKTASAATCAALANELAVERAGPSQPGGNEMSGDLAAGLFHQLSSQAYFVIRPDEVANILTFDWDPAKREATFTAEMPGLSAPDIHKVLVAPSGSFAGLRKFLGLTFKVNGRVSGPTAFEIEPYKIGGGQGSVRQSYTLLPTGELSVLSEQLKDGQWCCADYVALHKPIDRQELAKLYPRLVELGRTYQTAYNERMEAEKRQRRQERAELFGKLMQGALVATQAYAAGVQEANASNARAQALIASAAAVRPQIQPSGGVAGSIRTGASAERSASMPQASTSRSEPRARSSSASASAVIRADASGPAAEPALQNRTVRAYFVMGLEPAPGDTQNPLCYSNVFSVTFPWNPEGWGNAGRAADATAKYAPIFQEKCARLGKVNGPMPAANIEGVTSGWPVPPSHPTDRRVTLP